MSPLHQKQRRSGAIKPFQIRKKRQNSKPWPNKEKKKQNPSSPRINSKNCSRCIRDARKDRLSNHHCRLSIANCRLVIADCNNKRQQIAAFCYFCSFCLLTTVEKQQIF